jgi:hypothetical protein
MKIKNLFKYLVLIFFGVGCGIALSIYMFAIEVDFLSLPYLNKTVELTEDILVYQSGNKIEIPKGSQILLRKRMPSSNEYCLLINSYWDDEKLINFIPARAKAFEVGTPEGVYHRN